MRFSTNVPRFQGLDWRFSKGLGAALSLLALIGCGAEDSLEDHRSGAKSVNVAPSGAAVDRSPVARAAATPSSPMAGMMGGGMGGAMRANGSVTKPNSSPAAELPPAVARKIIYNAKVTVVSIAPWLPLLVLVALPLFVVAHRLWRRARVDLTRVGTGQR